MLTEQFNLDDALWAFRTDGEEEGIEKGIEKGIEQGIEKGIQIGEAKHARKVASMLRDYGVDMEIIINTTGLTEYEINQLTSEDTA
ncbi:MAG: hypothetical protein LBH66_07100, partial [Oscillospiraceae bacterium]|nr:hypothetical protein [Oscillospiraceae bacterium]